MHVHLHRTAQDLASLQAIVDPTDPAAEHGFWAAAVGKGGGGFTREQIIVQLQQWRAYPDGTVRPCCLLPGTASLSRWRY
jgi:hypothetical protein